LKKILNAAAGFALGGILLFFTFRGRNMEEVWQSIAGADLTLSLVSLLLMLLIFILRSARWQLLLHEAGANVTLIDVLSSLGLGYFVNCITPKLGEVARCLSLQKNSDVPLATSFGSVVSERMYDILMLFTGVAIIFFLEMERLGNLYTQISDQFKHLFGTGNIWYATLFAVIGVALIIVFRKKLMQIHLLSKVGKFIKQMGSAAKQSFGMRRYKLFILYTALIWFSLTMINFVFLKAMNIEGVDLYFAVIVLFISSIGWALPAPGGVGTSHFIVLQLFVAFGMGEENGLAYGIYSNGITLAFMLVFGLISVADYFWGKSWREKWARHKANRQKQFEISQ